MMYRTEDWGRRNKGRSFAVYEDDRLIGLRYGEPDPTHDDECRLEDLDGIRDVVESICSRANGADPSSFPGKLLLKLVEVQNDLQPLDSHVIIYSNLAMVHLLYLPDGADDWDWVELVNSGGSPCVTMCAASWASGLSLLSVLSRPTEFVACFDEIPNPKPTFEFTERKGREYW